MMGLISRRTIAVGRSIRYRISECSSLNARARILADPRISPPQGARESGSEAGRPFPHGTEAGSTENASGVTTSTPGRSARPASPASRPALRIPGVGILAPGAGGALGDERLRSLAVVAPDDPNLAGSPADQAIDPCDCFHSR